MIIQSGVNIDEIVNSLTKVKTDNVNWKIYYLDTNNNEKWVKEYPHSEMQAGGPPQLRLLNKFPWE